MTTTIPVFDPSSKHTKILGEDPRFDRAKYSQNGHYFTAQRKYVGSGPNALMPPSAPVEVTPPPDAEITPSEATETAEVPPPPPE